jgi:sulfur-carrier protein adenylyltransferase/sulfurtransferase
VDSTAAGRTILSLVDPAPPSRRICVWEGERRTVVAENDDQLRAWLRNFAPEIPVSKIKPRGGVLAWLDCVPLPTQYPSSAKDVYDLAESAGAAHLLDELAREARPRMFVVLGADTENGPALAAVVVNRPKVVRGRDPLVAGFRPSAVPSTCYTHICSAARLPTETPSSGSTPPGSTAAA